MQNSNINDEPNRGVAALFNGDLHAYNPAYAPRTHRIVIGQGDIRHVQHDLIPPDSFDGLTEIVLPEHGTIKGCLIDYYKYDQI